MDAAADDLAAQIRRLQDDLNAIKNSLAGKESNAACSCAACAEEAGKLAQHAKHQAQSAIADVETFARQHPAYVVGGALGAGLLLGLLMRRH